MGRTNSKGRKDRQVTTVCGECNVTVNPHVLVDKYPLPTAEYIFATLAVASFFFGVRIMLGTILGRFSIIYFRGLGLMIRVRVRVWVRVWVSVSVMVRVRVSVVLWSG